MNQLARPTSALSHPALIALVDDRAPRRSLKFFAVLYVEKGLLCTS